MDGRRHFFRDVIIIRLFEKEPTMRKSTLQALTASFAAVAVILSLGASLTLAAPGGGLGGGGHFGGGGMFTGRGFAGGGFHSGGSWNGGLHGYSHFESGYNACFVNPYSLTPNPSNPQNFLANMC
jgi:uncharacterized membrane protein